MSGHDHQAFAVPANKAGAVVAERTSTADADEISRPSTVRPYSPGDGCSPESRRHG